MANVVDDRAILQTAVQTAKASLLFSCTADSADSLLWRMQGLSDEQMRILESRYPDAQSLEFVDII